ncbi:hypothetical protein BVU17_13150 [Haloarcula taiwanensis]|uniref:Uncharacterized protein n=1 Tax=Haloarcula taiwanensis TaxID=1932004 RepID=A0A2H5A116_9EURY|nr:MULTISPECIES: hypothetical protein [Haloarcula]AUG48424.1 hypothetical protein BVU17_13150 [Haloarcula taiwanensis]RLM39781.1 hypothetical protein DVK01_04250 [Haloarcula sp. Atlit-120R]RLM47755.1 hypothetical protein DVK00_04405 [Haloarcula sp. Atlit-47R]RLM97033.1 hypothetical protein D3D01_04300 [Haloarcula sp. Atlit-7R]
MVVTISRDVLFQYYRFSLYNSPFDAHDEGCAIDLYPDGERAPSPVAGEVVDTKTVQAPPKAYAAEHDHLIVIDTGDTVARLLHVDPAVEPGETVTVGDDLGELVRAGFFAPWVPNHIHLGFRDPGTNPYRASGSLPVDVAVDVTPLSWDGTGTVVAGGETWVRLDEPVHPAPGDSFAGIANDIDGDNSGVLDGGLPHYSGGGLLSSDGTTAAAIAGAGVGTADGRTVAWDDLTVLANGDPITGIALFCGRERFGAKLVGEEVDLAVGDEVRVSIERDTTGDDAA